MDNQISTTHVVVKFLEKHGKKKKAWKGMYCCYSIFMDVKLEVIC